tara:strand:- start:599 stop:949 length:351 start_codon:yes stop_codon:yes gene_type:complete
MIYLLSKRTWILIFYVLLIIFLSTQQFNASKTISLFRFDKIVHFFEYMVLGFLMINMLTINRMSKTKWYLSILFFLIFPAIDEFLQSFIPNRTPDIYDYYADILGCFVGAYIRNNI